MRNIILSVIPIIRSINIIKFYIMRGIIVIVVYRVIYSYGLAE